MAQHKGHIILWIYTQVNADMVDNGQSVQWLRVVIVTMEAFGCAQKQYIMHDGPIITWRNCDLITPRVVPGDDAGNDDNDTPPDLPMFLLAPPLFLFTLLISMTLTSPQFHQFLLY